MANLSQRSLHTSSLVTEVKNIVMASASTQNSTTPTQSQRFNTKLFQQYLTTEWFGRNFICFYETESTMDDMRAFISKGAPIGSIVLSELQTKGRGRAGRQWSSQPKGNLYFSFYLSLPVTELGKLQLLVPLAVCKACNHVKVNARIKWPNDIWIGSQKLAGILIDSTNDTDDPNLFHLNIGIGINVNEDMKENPEGTLKNEAISLYAAKGQIVSRELILSQFCNNFEQSLKFAASEVLANYKEYDMLTGQTIIVMPKKKEDLSSYYKAIAIGISNSGNLIVRPIGEQKDISLIAEEVTIRPEDNSSTK